MTTNKGAAALRVEFSARWYDQQTLELLAVARSGELTLHH